MKKIIYTCIIFLSAFLSLYAGNLLKNPDFTVLGAGGSPEFWQSSAQDGITIEDAGGTKCARLYNGNNPRYLSLNQVILIDSEAMRRITVKAAVKINDVRRGAQEWEMARVMVLFFDKDGVQTGGWPELVRLSGTSDWSDKINVINVPDGARQVKIGLEMSNCTGEMFVKDLSVEAGDNLLIPREDDDYLINGSMEFGSTIPLYWGGWVNGVSAFESPGYKSQQSFKISNPSSAYSMITQQVPVDSKKIASITVSGFVKVSGVVQGENAWEKARISIEFHDSSGNRVNNEWPAVVGEAAYDINDWTQWEKTYQVPAGTVNIAVGAGLLNCSGTMWFDSIKLAAFDKKGKPVKPEIPKTEDRTGWFPFTFEEDDYRKGAVIDFTDELDKPAGKHGELSVSDNGGFIFADGTEARFWGTNIVGSDVFRNHIETDKMVKRLAKLGVNMVRLHHMDAWWAQPNIFQGVTDTTRALSPESMEKLDYLIYKLKDAGIYIFLDMLVHRKPKKDDGVSDFGKVPAGFKEVIYFDEKLQELTKEYITQLLEHENQYTKTAYKNERTIVMTEIVNESSLFYFDRNTEIPASYRLSLDKLFNSFLKTRYKNMSALKEAWDKYGDTDLSGSEDFNDNTVRRASFKYNYVDWSLTGASACGGRAADTKEFYYQTEYAFYKKFYDIIRSTGSKILITGSNHWERWDAELKANAAMDFIDRHAYWDHPSGGWSMQENISFANTPMIKSKQNCVAELGHNRIYGKPFTVTEYNSLIPNEYRAGFPLIMASYAKFNGWDAMLQFNFSNYSWKNTLGHFADFSLWPDTLSSWTPAVYIFSRGYIKTCPEKIVEYISDDNMFFDKNASFKLINKDYSAPLMIRSSKTFDPALGSKKFNPRLVRDAALSLTQELYWNFNKGIFQINADKIQGVAGFLNSEKEGFKFRNLRVKSKNNYASVFISAIDNEPLTNSSKILLNTSARIDNTGVKYSPSHTSVIYGGSSPILIEPVYAVCRLALSRFKSVKVYTLDANNYKKEEYKNFSTPDKNTLIITTDENSKTLGYYIEISR